MKTLKPILILLFMLFSFSFLTGESTYTQDSPPSVSNVQVQIINSINAVKITYDLFDAESDPMKVTLRISNDSGVTFLYSCDSVSGDVGYPVYSGNQKQIYWYYSAPPTSSLKAKVIANDLHPVPIQPIVNQVDSNRLLENLQFIEGIRHRTEGTHHLQEVKDSIYNRFLRYGLQTTIQNLYFEGYNAQNFEGRVPGTTHEDTTYIVDGHFDTVPVSPGADDNGSAVAAFFEISRILSNYNFRNSIKFIGFDLEERAPKIGSFHYVWNGVLPYEKIAGDFNLEMIGYYSNEPNSQSLPSGFCTLFPAFCDSVIAQQYRGNFIFNIANDSSTSLRYQYDSCARLYVPELRVLSLSVAGNGEIAPDLRRSDHANFWDHGYKALMLADGGNFRNHNYHTAGDTIGTLNIQFMTKVVKATLATVASIAGIENSGYGISGLFTISGVHQISGKIPGEYRLYQNFPNPFNPASIINYELPIANFVKLTVYDVLGREIAVLVNEKQQEGEYSINWDASNYPSGVYFYKLTAGDYNETKKMMLLK